MCPKAASGSLGTVLCLVAGLFFACGGKSQSDSGGRGGTGNVSGGSGPATDAMSAGGVANDASLVDASTVVVAAPIAAAVTHACAVVNGAAYCWGANDMGQLGDGTVTDSPVPVQVQGLTAGVQAVAAGKNLSCAIVEGKVYCWGDSGVNWAGGSRIPLQVQGLSARVQSIATSLDGCWAVIDGAVYGWGSNFSDSAAVPIQLEGFDAGVQAVAPGSPVCVVINGAAYCSGQDECGELGTGNLSYNSSAPVQVDGLTSGVTAIATGWKHVCAVMNGDVYCWGLNDDGQLGYAPSSATNECDPYNTTSSPPILRSCNPTPIKVQGLNPGVEAITAGTYHTCAIAGGAAYCWGANGSGQLGINSRVWSYVPAPVEGLAVGATAISAGANPDESGYDYDAGPFPSVVAIDMTCAVANGNVYCWGANTNGQLGNGTMVYSPVPVEVQFP